jgi:hypothetical protein
MCFYCYVYVFLLCVYISWSCQLALFGYPDRFFHAFSSVVRQMPGYNPQRRCTACTLPKFLCCFVYCLVSFCVLFVCKSVLYYCHRVATQLQLTKYIVSLIWFECFVWSVFIIDVLVRFCSCQSFYSRRCGHDVKLHIAMLMIMMTT